MPQYRTLVVLTYAGAHRLADLAESLGVSPSTATRMCDRLVRKGLITRTRDVVDRREVNLSVTNAGPEGGGRCDRATPSATPAICSPPFPWRPDPSLVEALGLADRGRRRDAPELDWSPGWRD